MLLTLQNSILEMIAKGEPLGPTIETLCEMVETVLPDVICSVLEVDRAGFIHPVAGPSLPAHYSQALEGLAIGANVGSCGTAAYFAKPVIVTDIETDPLWADFKALALPIGLRACWSTPIIGFGRVMGTFAFYFKEKRGPRKVEERIVSACVHLSAIAMERDSRVKERQKLAFTDALTELPNRAHFNMVFEEFNRKQDAPWGLLLGDLDNLKLINDTFGHCAGDDLIRITATRIAACTEPGLAFRLGGDEFAIIVKKDRPDALAAAADKVIAATKMPCECAGNLVHPSITLGGAYADSVISSEHLRQNADYALYHAKERNRGQFVEFVDGLGTAIMQRFRAIQDVTTALNEERIEAFYQPIVDLGSGRVKGFEALCRMISPDGEIISAGMFHEATKDAHVATRLTRRMFEKVAHDCRRWQDMGLQPEHISINLSEADFHNGNLGTRLCEIFSDAGASLRNVILEITESVYFAQKDQTIAHEIARLRQKGLRFALDDFGTGFASLTHLMSVPADILKIDRSFVARLAPGDCGSIIVEGLLSIASKLGFAVIAEGIETASQASQLIDYGCRLGQGFFFSKAVPFNQATALLRNLERVSTDRSQFCLLETGAWLGERRVS